MREYRITKSDLWYQIYRKKEEENWIIRMERLQRDTYTLNRDFARTFYHLNDATSALVIARIQWKKTPTTSIKKSGLVEGKEKKSWHEL